MERIVSASPVLTRTFTSSFEDDLYLRTSKPPLQLYSVSTYVTSGSRTGSRNFRANHTFPSVKDTFPETERLLLTTFFQESLQGTATGFPESKFWRRKFALRRMRDLTAAPDPAESRASMTISKTISTRMTPTCPAPGGCARPSGAPSCISGYRHRSRRISAHLDPRTRLRNVQQHSLSATGLKSPLLGPSAPGTLWRTRRSLRAILDLLRCLSA